MSGKNSVKTIFAHGWVLSLLTAVLFATGCIGENLEQTEIQEESHSTMNQGNNTGITQAPNRYFSGKGNVLVPPQRIALETGRRPVRWVVGTADASDSEQQVVWGVVRDDARWMTL